MTEKIVDKQPSEFPPQEQKQHTHGAEHEMSPRPKDTLDWYKGSSKLKDHVAIITGADSGIGRSVAVLFAREGANIANIYYQNDTDAEETKILVEKEGRKCLNLRGDIKDKQFCLQAVEKTYSEFKRIDILVNNSAIQVVKERIEDISEEQLDNVFKTNIYSMFYMTQGALKYIERSKNGSIINTTSINAWKGHPTLIDYTATKGAIVAFTSALSQNLIERKVRVNMVAPGPIWTPLNISSFDAEHVKNFGKQTPLGRAGEPEECAPCYVFLASPESSCITGQVIHVNGGIPY